MTTIDSVVYPTYRFGMVQEEIYRGGYPKQRNIPFLKRLDLKTIISLTPNPVDIVDLLNNEGSGNHNNRDSVINKLDLKLNTIENKNNNIDPISNNGNESQIQYIHIKTDKPKEDNIPISFSKINQILLLLIDTNNYPIYIHCLDGSIVTSLVILCFRKLQCWPLQASLAEAGRFLKDDNLTNEESLFIEKYPGDFEIPNNLFTRLPKWLWSHVPMMKKHPTLKLRILTQDSIATPTCTIPSIQQTQMIQEMTTLRSSFSIPNLIESLDKRSSFFEKSKIEMVGSPSPVELVIDNPGMVDPEELSRNLMALDLEMG